VQKQIYYVFGRKGNKLFVKIAGFFLFFYRKAPIFRVFMYA